MGLFGKKRDNEIIDFSDMQKRGLITPSLSKSDTDRDGFVDFSASSMINSSPQTKQNSNPAGDFLSSLADAGDSVTDNLRTARQNARFNENPRINEVRIKTEDNEYKIKQLEERIRQLESKLNG